MTDMEEKLWEKLNSIEAGLQRHVLNTESTKGKVNDVTLAFNQHIEIYRKNGEQIKKNNENIQGLTNDVHKHIKSMEPVILAFNSLSWVKRALLGIVIAVGTVAGAIIAVKELFMRK